MVTSVTIGGIAECLMVPKHYLNRNLLTTNYTVSQKKITLMLHTRFNPHQPISVIFGREVDERVPVLTRFSAKPTNLVFMQTFPTQSLTDSMLLTTPSLDELLTIVLML